MGISRTGYKTIFISLAVFNSLYFLTSTTVAQDFDEITYIKGILNKVRNAPLPVDPNATKAPKEKALPKGTFRIAQILPQNPPVAIVVGGRKHGVIPHSLLDSYRYAPAPTEDGQKVKVITGRLKVIHVDDNYTMATIIRDGGLISTSFFPEHPATMAGDLVAANQPMIVRKPVLTPETTLLYSDLFVDPKAYPTTFELTEEGMVALKAAAKKFQHLRVPILMIEAYTNKEGPTEANQVESYERALTIRQFLINQMGFSPSRVVAIGLGESNQINNNNVSGYQGRNRRVVLKVNMHQQPSH